MAAGFLASRFLKASSRERYQSYYESRSTATAVQPVPRTTIPADVGTTTPGDVGTTTPADVGTRAPGDVGTRAPGDVRTSTPTDGGYGV